MDFLWFCFGIISLSQATGIMDNVLFAVNCGGDAHTDTHGKIFIDDRWKENGLF